jgi:hypothetical protein
MPYEVKWLVPQQVIEMKFGENFTIEELQEYDAKVVAMLDTGQPRSIHILAHASDIKQMPNLVHAQQLNHIRHPNLGWAVPIGNQNIILKAIGLLVAKLFGNRLQWCASREEALTFLQQVDKTLPDLK